MLKKSYWLAVQVKKTTLSYKVLCVKFNDIFKDIFKTCNAYQ